MRISTSNFTEGVKQHSPFEGFRTFQDCQKPSLFLIRKALQGLNQGKGWWFMVSSPRANNLRDELADVIWDDLLNEGIKLSNRSVVGN